jgi:hypothetical protein
MKKNKRFIILIWLFFIHPFLFADEEGTLHSIKGLIDDFHKPKTKETWIALNLSFTNALDFDQNTALPFFGAPGIGVSSYAFSNFSNFGTWTQVAYMLPVVLKLVDSSYSYQFGYYISGVHGLAYRHKTSDNTTFIAALGINIDSSSEHYTVPDVEIEMADGSISYETTEYTIGKTFLFGIGGDIGLKYDISDKYFISFGCGISYGFLYYGSEVEKFNNVSIGDAFVWRTDSLLSLRPYICIGVNRLGIERSARPGGKDGE